MLNELMVMIEVFKVMSYLSQLQNVIC